MREVFTSKLSCPTPPFSQLREEGMGEQPQVPWHLFCVLVAEDLGIVAV